jgi:hypothetical protein
MIARFTGRIASRSTRGALPRACPSTPARSPTRPAEGGLNDGAAFPFVLLALGLLGLHDFGGTWHWMTVDVLWSIAGGLVIGGGLGALIGRLVLRLRIRHQEAVGLDEFLALGLIAIAYGIAQISLASGFLAVFAAGLALQRVKEHSKRGPRANATKVTMTLGAEGERAIATRSRHAGVYLMDALQGFNGQLERLAVERDGVGECYLGNSSVATRRKPHPFAAASELSTQ